MLPIPTTNSPIDSMFLESYLFESRQNRITPSAITKVKKGVSNVTVVTIKSNVPYSSVVSIAVYHGTNKKLKALLEKLPIVNNKVFDANLLYCPIVHFPHFINEILFR